MNSQQTRTIFTDFFRERGHSLILGSTLIPPEGDGSVLFTSSGMHPLTPYLEGRPHPQGRRLINCQRCLRTSDLDEVGDGTHLTLFEMLGSWSLGDYTYQQSLRWGLQLMTEGFGIGKERLALTVFGGDGECPPDTGSEEVWCEWGLPRSRITRTTHENWWSNGGGGLCGPDSEIFVWCGRGQPQGNPISNTGWVEVWNHVHMRFHRDESGRLHELPVRNVDTGMGFERLLSVLQGVSSVYETDIFEPWMRCFGEELGLSGTSLRLMCDHTRSGVVIIGDGVLPSNTGRGYVLRRLIRRSLNTLWRHDSELSLNSLPHSLIEDTLGWFALPQESRELVVGVILGEERRYRELRERGRKIVEHRLQQRPLTEDDYRDLYETNGLPRELVEEFVSVQRSE
jgi:alanyl-tRNA synthetase